jgi:hypothetical protein
MKKMKLDCEALEVESFGTGKPAGEQGTVHGHATQWVTCPGRETCGRDETCAGTSAPTGDTCYTCLQSCVIEYCTSTGC